MVELRLQLQPDKVEQYICRQLRSIFNEGEIRNKFVRSILEHSNSYLALARLSIDDLMESSDRVEIHAIRDRLSSNQTRFFNLALQRVKMQDSEHDRRLGLAIITLVGLAGFGEDRLSFGALKGALMLIQVATGWFGLPLTRLRISQVTRGWIDIEPLSEVRNDSPPVVCFTPLAQVYLSEECPELLDSRSRYCCVPYGRDFARFCLEAINQGAVGKFPNLDPRTCFLKYAVQAWPRFYKQHWTEATATAAIEFFSRYRNSAELQNLYFPTECETKRSVSHEMLIVAAYDLWELIPSLDLTNMDVRDVKTGRTPLMVAVEAGNEQFLAHLVSRKADLSIKCERGESALWLAVLDANLDIVRTLVRHGGATLINAQDHEGQTAGQTVLMLAVQKHSKSKGSGKSLVEEPVTKILKLCASQRFLSHKLEDNCGRLALHHAAALQDTEALHVLLSLPACRKLINQPENNDHKRTALMNLTLGKNAEVSEAFAMMIKFGASVDSCDSRRRTVLHYAAAKSDFTSAVARIIDGGGKVDVKDQDGRTPLHIAAIHGCDEIARLMLLAADPVITELRDNDYQTALELAMICQNDSFVRVLAEYKGLHEMVRQGQDLTPGAASGTETGLEPVEGKFRILNYQRLHLAVHRGIKDHVKALLLSETEDCNAVTIDGNTALHLALQSLQSLYVGVMTTCEEFDDERDNLKSIIYELITHHWVDINLRNHAHETALDLAKALAIPEHRLCLAIREVAR
jgi:ankyrin repeat protein